MNKECMYIGVDINIIYSPAAPLHGHPAARIGLSALLTDYRLLILAVLAVVLLTVNS